MPEPLRETPAWRRLQWHHADIRHRHLRELLGDDPTRGERLAAEAAGLRLDYSKHLVTDDTLDLLRKLAAERGLEGRIRALFRGEPLKSGARPALHVAFRMPPSRSLVVDGVDVVKEVHEELVRIDRLAQAVRTGERAGATGRPIRNVLDLGIGGSDLGPAMAYEALRPYASHELRLRFVANVDPADLARATRGLDPEETLVIVVSKTMGTPETTRNAQAAREWIAGAVGDEVGAHFVAVTANAGAAVALGVPEEQVFRMWDRVGGQTSLCSAVGLSLALAIGGDRFRELRAGCRTVDEHFASTPLGANLPAIAGLLAVWYRGFFGLQTRAVVPYSRALRLFPAYVQQLELESLGKQVTEAGEPVDVDTGAIVLGGEGTNAHHVFFQLLHQGTTVVPVDLIVFARPVEGSTEDAAERHDLLAAGAFAQARTLAFGRSAAELEDAGVSQEEVPHRVTPGNRPTSILLARGLDPATLGALIAFYEHGVFTQAAVWGIDPFDRWGVEPGEELAAKIAPELASGWKRELMHDSSTNALIRRYRELRDAEG